MGMCQFGLAHAESTAVILRGCSVFFQVSFQAIDLGQQIGNPAEYSGLESPVGIPGVPFLEAQPQALVDVPDFAATTQTSLHSFLLQLSPSLHDPSQKLALHSTHCK